MILARACIAVIVAATLMPGYAPAQEYPVDAVAVRQARDAFVERVSRESGFERESLRGLLESAEIKPEILEAISRPAERVVPWYDYREIFLTDTRIDAGLRFWMEQRAFVEAASEQYGVEPEMLIAIIGIESLFGERMGRYRVIDALSTLAFAYPPRSAFFTSELEAFLVFNREQNNAHIQALGSYAGAMGAGQFIPSSYRAYAVDANGDGLRDLWADWEDILGSVANYFSRHGWRRGEFVAEPVSRAARSGGSASISRPALNQTVASLRQAGYEFDGSMPGSTPAAVINVENAEAQMGHWVVFHNFRVITRYNNSTKYALAAHLLSQAIREAYLSAMVSNGR